MANAFEALAQGARNAKSSNAGPSTGANGQASTAVNKVAQPWVEKYRPKNIDSVGGQEATTRVLKKALGRADVRIS